MGGSWLAAWPEHARHPVGYDGAAFLTSGSVGSVHATGETQRDICGADCSCNALLRDVTPGMGIPTLEVSVHPPRTCQAFVTCLQVSGPIPCECPYQMSHRFPLVPYVEELEWVNSDEHPRLQVPLTL